MGGVGLTNLGGRGGATAAINRARSPKGLPPLEATAATASPAPLSSSSSSEDNQSSSSDTSSSSLLHQQIGGGGRVAGAGGEGDDERRRKGSMMMSAKYAATALALAAGTAMAVLPGPQVGR